METYWCTKKNAIVNWINKWKDFNQALTSCRKSECESAPISVKQETRSFTSLQRINLNGHTTRPRIQDFRVMSIWHTSFFLFPKYPKIKFCKDDIRCNQIQRPHIRSR
jgi:hypothetical protein